MTKEIKQEASYTWGNKFSIRYVGYASELVEFINNMAIGLK